MVPLSETIKKNFIFYFSDNLITNLLLGNFLTTKTQALLHWSTMVVMDTERESINNRVMNSPSGRADLLATEILHL